MLSLAANDPNRLVICTADSSGALPSAAGKGGYIDLPSSAGGGGPGGGGVGSRMRGTAWGLCRVLRGRSRCRHGVAPDEKLCRDRGRNGGGGLIVNLGEADRADQTGEVVVGKADLAQRASKARALGGAADHAHIGKPAGQQRRRRDVEVEGVAVGHDR